MCSSFSNDFQYFSATNIFWIIFNFILKAQEYLSADRYFQIYLQGQCMYFLVLGHLAVFKNKVPDIVWESNIFPSKIFMFHLLNSHQNEIAKQSRGENLSMLMYKTVSQTIDSTYSQLQLLIR